MHVRTHAHTSLPSNIVPIILKVTTQSITDVILTTF